MNNEIFNGIEVSNDVNQSSFPRFVMSVNSSSVSPNRVIVPATVSASTQPSSTSSNGSTTGSKTSAPPKKSKTRRFGDPKAPRRDAHIHDHIRINLNAFIRHRMQNQSSYVAYGGHNSQMLNVPMRQNTGSTDVLSGQSDQAYGIMQPIPYGAMLSPQGIFKSRDF